MDKTSGSWELIPAHGLIYLWIAGNQRVNKNTETSRGWRNTWGCISVCMYIYIYIYRVQG